MTVTASITMNTQVMADDEEHLYIAVNKRTKYSSEFLFREILFITQQNVEVFF